MNKTFRVGCPYCEAFDQTTIELEQAYLQHCTTVCESCGGTYVISITTTITTQVGRIEYAGRPTDVVEDPETDDLLEELANE